MYIHECFHTDPMWAIENVPCKTAGDLLKIWVSAHRRPVSDFTPGLPRYHTIVYVLYNYHVWCSFPRSSSYTCIHAEMY